MMFYKSSILTATFALLSVSNTTFFPERSYANTSEVTLNRDTASDYELETSDLITLRPKPEELKAKLDPLDIDRISNHTKLDPVVNTWGNVVINPDLPPVQPTSLFAKGDDSHSKQQVKHLAQLVDLEPTDWEFQSLKALNERYNCLVGDGDTFKNSQGLTRDKFAASLKICLDRIDKSIVSSNTKLASNDDSETLKQLQEEFAPELANLRKRADALDARVATLESQQFSPNTRLFGQAIFGIQGRTRNRADLFPRDGIRESQDPGDNISVLTSTQLTLVSQFNNRSILLAGLQAGSGSTAPRLTNNVRLAYEGNTNNNLVLSDLTYRFLLGDKFAAIVGAEGLNMVSVFRGPNRVESAGSGPISAFAQRNPILNIGGGRTGVGFDWQFDKRASLQAVYTANNAASSSKGAGLFDGYTTTGVQLAITPVDPLDITIYYANAYSPDGTLLTGVGDDQLVPMSSNGGVPLRTNAIGSTLNWRINNTMSTGGWVGYTNSQSPGLQGSTETINWMAFLNLPNLFGAGNLGGIYIGQPPRIISSNLPIGNNLPDLLNGGLGNPGGQPGATTHVELFYRWRLSDNISITPGITVLFQPRNTSTSDTITVGTLRTTFTF